MNLRSIRLQISTKVISLEMEIGHLKWKVVDLSRACKISRTLIYYYLGKDKMSILYNSINIVTEDYFALSGARRQFAKQGKLFESILITRERLKSCPQLITFYLKWRFEKSEISNQLENIEKKYREKLSSDFPHLSDYQVTMLHAFLHGVVTAPFYTETEIKSSIENLTKNFRLEYIA